MKFRSLLAFFGPGAIIACVTIGSGETVFASRGGAIFGYALLWCFIMSTVIKGVQVYAGARFMTLTGAHPLESWSEIPGPKNWLVWFMAFLAIAFMPFWLGGGLPRMLGDFTNSIIGFPDAADVGAYEFYGRLWGTVFIVFAITFTFIQSYQVLEKVQTVIVALLLLCMFAAAVTCHPDFSGLVSGLVVPRIPDYEPWIDNFPKIAARDRLVEVIVYLGAIGGGTQDYLGYLGMMRERAWGMVSGAAKQVTDWKRDIDPAPENVANGRRWLRAPLIDVLMSFAAILLFTLCFAVLGATILHPREMVPEGFSLLTEQATFLVREDQPRAVQVVMTWIYRTGVFFAFFGTIYGAYELYTRTAHECLTAAMPRLRRVPLLHFRIATILWCGVPGLLLLWFTTKDPVAILTPAAIVSSTFACGVWCFAILWSDKKHLPAPLRMPWLLKLALVASGLILCLLGIIGLYKQYA